MKTRILSLAALLLVTLSSRPMLADLAPDPVVFSSHDNDDAALSDDVVLGDLAPEPQVHVYANQNPMTLIIAGSALALGLVIGGLLWARSARASAQRDMVNASPDVVKVK